MARNWIAGLIAVWTLACGGTDHSDKDVIHIGAIFALTGATSDVGTLYADGVRDFIGWTNGQGGIEGRPVELLFQDYGYRVDRAEQLYSEFVGEGVVAFMGWGTGDTEALRGRISQDQVPFMSASYSHVLGDPTEAPFNFLVGTTYSDQLLIVLDWILENEDAPPKVALLHHASPFGLSPYEQLGRDYAAEKGIELLAQEMPRGSTDYSSELTRAREWGARYVVFQNTSAPVSVVLRNAATMGYAPTFACLNWCANELLVELAGDATDGVVGAMPFAPPSEGVPGLEAARSYLDGYGGGRLEDKGVPYAQGWWTMAVMAEGIRRVVRSGAPLTGAAVKAALEELSDYDTGGVTFPITFTPSDHRGAKGMRLFRVVDGAWAPLTEFRHAPSQ
jgi:branched-chain amino acid transport system substrate-binding protein